MAWGKNVRSNSPIRPGGGGGGVVGQHIDRCITACFCDVTMKILVVCISCIDTGGLRAAGTLFTNSLKFDKISTRLS